MSGFRGTASDWNDHDLLTALRMRDEGASFAVIGRHLGRTRSSVAGTIRRLVADYAASEESDG